MSSGFLIFRVVLVKLVELLQSLVFITLFLEVVVLRSQSVHLFLQALVFRSELLESGEIILQISKPSSYLINSLLKRNYSHIRQHFKWSAHSV